MFERSRRNLRMWLIIASEIAVVPRPRHQGLHFVIRDSQTIKALEIANSHIAEADLFGVLGDSDDDTRRSIPA